MTEEQCCPTLKLVHKGKVRETYQTEKENYRLMVATDRISTHNIVYQDAIPKKGEILTALTIFWSQLLHEVGISTHIVAFGQDIYKYLPVGTYPSDLHDRAIVVQYLDMIPVEFIFRNHLTGSLWNGYSKGEVNPYGIDLPENMKMMEEFPVAVFTPTDKSETDEPLDSMDTKALYPDAYNIASQVMLVIRGYLHECGLELIDSKLELGYHNGHVVLGDEIVTPDSSRIVPLNSIKVGQNLTWLDKQPVRDEAERMWNGGPKIPLEFSADTINQTTSIYEDVFARITGYTLEAFQNNNMR